jgi:hypothetical protein
MTVSLQFSLEVDDEWPPVGSESLPCAKRGDGYEVLASPLFVKGISVHDVIRVEQDANGFVESWKHSKQSDHTTVWLLRMKIDNNIHACLAELRDIGCNTASNDDIGCYSIDVPGEISIHEVDAY